jgi:hypothetical protein
MDFVFSPAEIPQVKEVTPVHSQKEDMIDFVTIEPMDYYERPFVFTTISETSGTFTLQGIYHGIYKEGEEIEAVPMQTISKKVAYDITGDRVFLRDRDGIILKSEAMRLVIQKQGLDSARIRANLIYDEMGFLNWWVTYSKIDKTQKEVEKAYLVNPYLGHVKWQVPPYVETKEEKKVPIPFKQAQRYAPESKE